MKDLSLNKQPKVQPAVDLSQAQQAVCDCGGQQFRLYVNDGNHASCPTCGLIFTLGDKGWQRPLTDQEVQAAKEAEKAAQEAAKAQVAEISEPAPSLLEQAVAKGKK